MKIYLKVEKKKLTETEEKENIIVLWIIEKKEFF